MVMGLLEGAKAGGLDPERALAEAMALGEPSRRNLSLVFTPLPPTLTVSRTPNYVFFPGIHIPEDVADMAGVKLPSAELVAQLRELHASDITDGSDGEEDGEGGDGDTAGEEDMGWGSGVDVDEDDGRPGGSHAPGGGGAEGRREAAAAAPAPVARRTWGAGIARAAAARRMTPALSGTPSAVSGAPPVRTTASGVPPTELQTVKATTATSAARSTTRRPFPSPGSASASSVADVPARPPASATAMTLSQLRELAGRKGLDLEALLAGARAKGIEIREDL